MPTHGTTDARGYGSRHKRLRKQLEPIVTSGQAICWRCAERILPGQSWDLGHDDDDRNAPYRGPEHALKADCAAGGNRSAGIRKRHGTALNLDDDDESVTYPPCDTFSVVVT
ncbi:hypothetical protein [Mycolicibacterium vanbaalenii]|uniref:hypothetical protein n=1 Tax=Mycolicibacterium vanbaalenii TaxID=110539 RepID=UPI0021F29878|nr:hypothetical protein [Mycolicibacterium vanbaalenii]MCV7127014.1 hypothetical protein [Mycolicibacterium vanbaalenii PYR-1]